MNENSHTQPKAVFTKKKGCINMGDTTHWKGGGTLKNLVECGRFLVDQRPSLEVMKWRNSMTPLLRKILESMINEF